MKIISVVLISIGILSGLLGTKSFWRDQAYEKASIPVKGSVEWLEFKPMSGKAVASIAIMLSYIRDGIVDSTEHQFSILYTTSDPLPTEEELKAAPYYVRYVPKEKRNETTFPNRVMVSNGLAYEGFYNHALFGQMFTFILLGLMIRLFGRKKQLK